MKVTNHPHLPQQDINEPLIVIGQAGNIHIDDGGEGGIPVVFAHSFAGNSTNWKYQLEDLRKKIRAIAFDFRGHGRSALGRGHLFAAEALAQDIAAVVDGLQLNRFVLVGHSMGGAAAIAYAGRYPERVAGLVMAGTPGKSNREMMLQMMERLEGNEYQDVMDSYMEQLTQGAANELLETIDREMEKLDKTTVLNIVSSMFQYNPMPDLLNYKGPKFIIASEREEQQPNSLMHQCPEIQHVVIKGTSHWTQFDAPDDFNASLDGFLVRNVETL